MAREPFNEEWANSPAPDQFEKPPAGTFASGWVGGAQGQLPEAKWENWWHNRVDAAMQQIERQGYMAWHSQSQYLIGGFAIASDGNPYVSITGSEATPNVGNDPVSDGGVNWDPVPRGLATAAEAQALESLTKILTPGRLNSALKGENQSLSGNGYQRLPGGLILQWGRRSFSHSGAGILSASITFPIAFPNAVLNVSLAANTNNPSRIAASLGDANTNGFTMYSESTSGSGSPSHHWFALGH